MRHMAWSVLLVSAALAGCSKDGGSEPKGQVMATVDGKEVTVAEVNLELNGAKGKDLESTKRLQAAALQGVVARHLLADEARKQGLDKTPEAAIAFQRAQDVVLGQQLEKKLQEAVPKPSKSEADAFIAKYPSSFAQRKLFVVEQLVVTNPSKPLVDTLVKVETMPEIQQALDANKAKVTRTLGVLDSLQMDPDAAEKIASLKPDEPFITPDASGLRINRITNTVVQPVPQEDAQKLALQKLTAQRISGQIRQQMSEIVKAGQKDVKYSKDFEGLIKKAQKQK